MRRRKGHFELRIVKVTKRHAERCVGVKAGVDEIQSTVPNAGQNREQLGDDAQGCNIV